MLDDEDDVVLFVVVAPPLSFGCVASMAVSGPKTMMMIGVWRSVVVSRFSVVSNWLSVVGCCFSVVG